MTRLGLSVGAPDRSSHIPSASAMSGMNTWQGQSIAGAHGGVERERVRVATMRGRSGVDV